MKYVLIIVIALIFGVILSTFLALVDKYAERHSKSPMFAKRIKAVLFVVIIVIGTMITDFIILP
jgi:membrane protein CcdC involved in cytochrome C biogenesis